MSNTEEKITTWIDTQAESPYPIWALSAASNNNRKERNRFREFDLYFIHKQH